MAKKTSFFISVGLGIFALLIVVYCLYIRFFTVRYERTSPQRIMAITLQVPGKIHSLYVRENQIVHAGEYLFSLDATPFRQTLENTRRQIQYAFAERQQLLNQLSVASTMVSQEKQELMQLQVQWIKLAMLGKLDRKAPVLPVLQQEIAGATNALNDAEKTASALQAQLGSTVTEFIPIKLALLQLRIAENNLAHTVVEAPVSGYISNLHLAIGQPVRAGETSMLIISRS